MWRGAINLAQLCSRFFASAQDVMGGAEGGDHGGDVSSWCIIDAQCLRRRRQKMRKACRLVALRSDDSTATCTINWSCRTTPPAICSNAWQLVSTGTARRDGTPNGHASARHSRMLARCRAAGWLPQSMARSTDWHGEATEKEFRGFDATRTVHISTWRLRFV